MATPESTPIRHAKLGISTTKSLPLTNEYKRLLTHQHQRLALKHQQDLDLIDDIRSYIKARLSLEKDYTGALNKLSRQHCNNIAKKFALLHQLEQENCNKGGSNEQQSVKEDDPQKSTNLTRRLLNMGNRNSGSLNSSNNQTSAPTRSNTNNGKEKTNTGPNTNSNSGANHFDVPETACSLYKVWSEHINRLSLTSKSRAEQFDQLVLIVDKLKDIRSHKAHIGKKCLDTHLKRIQEDLLVSMVDLERAKKLYYEDESQAKKARENEEKIKKKRSGLLTKFTDLQAKKERSSAQREATDIQSTQARNDYIMALAAANAHLDYYYQRDLNDFIHLIDDGVLDHCKIFMATLSECDINSLKESLSHAQFWSKLIAMTGSQQTNHIFMECEQSQCLKGKMRPIEFEPCNNDPVNKISLEHNADYALQHEIDKWFTWFKKECRNLSHLVHQLESCQNALADGKKSLELNGQTIDDLEPKMIELKQQIRKCEAAKLKAQARLKVIKEGGMPIEEWSAVESEIAADMARAQEEQERARRSRELKQASGSGSSRPEDDVGADQSDREQQQGSERAPIQLQVSHESDLDSEAGAHTTGALTPNMGNESMHNLASVSRSSTNYIIQKQQNAISGYSALADPSLAWQDDYSATDVWGGSNTTTIQAPGPVVVTSEGDADGGPQEASDRGVTKREDGAQALLGAKEQKNGQNSKEKGGHQAASMSIQSSSPLSAIVGNTTGQQANSQSPYQLGMMSEAYKSDFECDYALTGSQQQARMMHSSASSAEPHNIRQSGSGEAQQQQAASGQQEATTDVQSWLNRRVVALYAFEKSNDDDLALQEDDVLLVTSVTEDDTNWVRARNIQTGEEGYVPSSYISLQEDATPTLSDNFGQETNFDPEQRQFSSDQQERVEENLAAEEGGSETAYCRALYDYDPPDEDTLEEDGLPHLAVKQGETMRVIDQGEEDGWWLVEKPDGVRGHVPSMLMEELDEVGEDEDGDEAEEEEGSRESNSYEDPVSIPPPMVEAPKLLENEPEPSQESAPKAKAGQNSLVPTQFVIIEPTPEVESKKFLPNWEGEQSGDDPVAEQTAGDEDQARGEETQNDHHQYRAPTSYSVIKEDFILEAPTRRPTAEGRHQTQHEPTIEEESSADITTDKSDTNKTDVDQPVDDLAHGADNEDQIIRMPQISVVIDTVEAIPRSPDDSFDRDQEEPEEEKVYSPVAEDGPSNDRQEMRSFSDDTSDEIYSNQTHSPTVKAKNVDCSPILRHHAEEFSKIIIQEALMLAPGSKIGPSTSSASINNCQRFPVEDLSEEE